MFRALYTAASGMNAQQLNLDNVANNLANTSTAGFRRRRVQFTDLLYQNMVMPGSASTQQTTNAAGLQVGLGTKPALLKFFSSKETSARRATRWISRFKAQDFSRCACPMANWLTRAPGLSIWIRKATL